MLIKFDTDNAAFDGDYIGYEIARILGDIAEKINGGRIDGVVIDINGNMVGGWSL